MNTKLNETFLNQTVEKMVKSKKVFSAALCVEDGSGTFAWHGAAGEMGKDDTYFIASVTKLYVTIVVQRLIDEQKLSLDDKIAKYLPAEMVKGLHILKGTDYSNQITIRHLISNTSGIPDYFFHKGGMINFTRFIAGYYGNKGITCNCISPGGFQTESQPEAFVRQYSDRTMLGRLAGDEDLKGIIVFLASAASSYITGANIPVDGGYTAK